MTIIGDAVAGADFHAPSRSRAAQTACRRGSGREPKHEDPHRQPADRRRGRLVLDRAALGRNDRRCRNRPRQGRRGRLEAIGKAAFANNEVVDVDLIDVELVDGAIRPLRLRERIRAAGPTNRLDLGKQARPATAQAA